MSNDASEPKKPLTEIINGILSKPEKKENIVTEFLSLREQVDEHTFNTALVDIIEGGELIREEVPRKGFMGLFGYKTTEQSWQYGFVKQLHAIEFAGETASQEMLNYLSIIAQHRLTILPKKKSPGKKGYALEFTHIGGELKHELEQDPGLHSFNLDRLERYGLESCMNESEMDDAFQETPGTIAYRTLLSSIEKLKTAIHQRNIETNYQYDTVVQDKYPGRFETVERAEDLENHIITYAVIHPSNELDDENMLLRWNSDRKEWTYSASLNGNRNFGSGEHLRLKSSDSERAAFILLTHFNQTGKRNMLNPEKVARMSPEELTSYR